MKYRRNLGYTKCGPTRTLKGIGTIESNAGAHAMFELPDFCYLGILFVQLFLLPLLKPLLTPLFYAHISRQ